MVIENTEFKNETIYKSCVCGRCKKTVLLEYLSTKDFDGGFTKINEFEKKPVGWEYNSFLQTTLCDTCSKTFGEISSNFMRIERKVGD